MLRFQSGNWRPPTPFLPGLLHMDELIVLYLARCIRHGWRMGWQCGDGSFYLHHHNTPYGVAVSPGEAGVIMERI